LAFNNEMFLLFFGMINKTTDERKSYMSKINLMSFVTLNGSD